MDNNEDGNVKYMADDCDYLPCRAFVVPLCSTLSYTFLCLLYYCRIIGLFLLRHRLLAHNNFVLHHPNKVYVNEVNNWYCILGKFFFSNPLLCTSGLSAPCSTSL